jgi:hypothetical protein
VVWTGVSDLQGRIWKCHNSLQFKHGKRQNGYGGLSQMKKAYEKPEIEIIVFESEDICYYGGSSMTEVEYGMEWETE